jgi:hypothetical protein
MNKKYFPKKSTLLLLAITLVLISGALILYTYNKHKRKSTATPSLISGNYINYDPPTQQEKNEADSVKQKIVEKKDTNGPTAPANITPIISYASKTSVNAFVPGVFEDGGMCKASFTQNDITINRTVTGFANSNYTQCAPIIPNLPNENRWVITIYYKSAQSSGSSQSQEIQ